MLVLRLKEVMAADRQPGNGLIIEGFYRESGLIGKPALTSCVFFFHEPCREDSGLKPSLPE
jgi:hypothetical protein